MDVRSPADWVDRAAHRDPDAVALAFADGVVTYGQLIDQVHRRSRDLRREWSSGPDTGEILRIAVRLDLPSIVELLAHQHAGLVPLPDAADLRLDGGRADAVLAVATSGTSGARRIVPLTMDNVAASVSASRARLGTGRSDRWLLCLPIDHVGGLLVLFRSFEAGGSVVVAPFGPPLADLITRARPTVVSLVPTMLHRLLDAHPEVVSAVRTVLVGGGRLPGALVERAAGAGVGLVATYGSTETSSQVATMAPGEPVRHAGYVGAPLEGFTVTIDGDDPSGVGTITVDGPAVFGGYVGEPARVGPHRTSDIGKLAPDGTLTVLGRSDDVVVTGGVNVSLTGIADSISATEGVDDVAVVGIEDDEWGTEVCALVVSDLSASEVQARLGDRLTGASVPRRILVAASVPLLPNGKHDLVAVRAAFSGDRPG